MPTDAKLNAEPRERSGKGWNRKLRATGRVPAVVYGHGEQTRSVSLDAHQVSRLFERIHVENTILELAIEGEGAPVRVLVREVQRHAFRPDVLHVDFYQIHAGERITLGVPIRVVGQSPGVKVGGMLQQSLDELEVRCLPDQIPETIEVDVSALEIGDSVHVGQLVLPEGVESLIDAECTICSVIPPVVAAATEEEEAAAALAEVPETEPEVIRRGREDEEESGD